MAMIDRRRFAAACGISLLAGPLLAQGRRAEPADFSGRVFVNERGGVRVHTYMADPKGALVTSHVIETSVGLVVVDGQFIPPAALELRRYIEGLGKPIVRLIVSHMHPDHWFGVHHLAKMPVHCGPFSAKFMREGAARLIAERKADSSVPEIGGVIADGSEIIGGVELRFRTVLDTEAPEIVVIELPAAGVVIVQDIVYNKVHAVVSRQIDNWVAVIRDLEKRGNAQTIVLAGHGEPVSPADLAGLVSYLETVKPLLTANIGKPENAKAITDEIVKAFPDYRVPPLLTLGLSRALPG